MSVYSPCFPTGSNSCNSANPMIILSLRYLTIVPWPPSDYFFFSCHSHVSLFQPNPSHIFLSWIHIVRKLYIFNLQSFASIYFVCAVRLQVTIWRVLGLTRYIQSSSKLEIWDFFHLVFSSNLSNSFWILHPTFTLVLHPEIQPGAPGCSWSVKLHSQDSTWTVTQLITSTFSVQRSTCFQHYALTSHLDQPFNLWLLCQCTSS